MRSAFACLRSYICVCRSNAIHTHPQCPPLRPAVRLPAIWQAKHCSISMSILVNHMSMHTHSRSRSRSNSRRVKPDDATGLSNHLSIRPSTHRLSTVPSPLFTQPGGEVARQRAPTPTQTRTGALSWAPRGAHRGVSTGMKLLPCEWVNPLISRVSSWTHIVSASMLRSQASHSKGFSHCSAMRWQPKSVVKGVVWGIGKGDGTDTPAVLVRIGSNRIDRIAAPSPLAPIKTTIPLSVRGLGLVPVTRHYEVKCRVLKLWPRPPGTGNNGSSTTTTPAEQGDGDEAADCHGRFV